MEAVVALMRACEAHEEGEAEMALDDLRGTWERPRFELLRDAWVVEAPEGGVAGYVDVWDRDPGVRYIADGYVHPGWRGRGIGTRLVRLAEARVRERLPAVRDDPPLRSRSPQGERKRVVIRHTVFHGSEESRRLLEREGYSPVAYFWRMVRDMESPPPESSVPEGVTIRTFEEGRDKRAVHALVQEAFSDNADYAPLAFQEWVGFMVERESFDPSLYFLAFAREELVGVALCPRYNEMGWVRQLAVRRGWRRRGVGRALMERVFAEFYRRGQRRVGLVVESYNRTGAKQFYESLGMHVERQHDRYEKVVS